MYLAREHMDDDMLFFHGDFHTPLTPETAGDLAPCLEMVRLGPSAVNHQPWRLVKVDNALHFYLKRSKGYSSEGRPDMQMVDMGIALCHFELMAKEKNISGHITRKEPVIDKGELIYVFSWVRE